MGKESAGGVGKFLCIDGAMRRGDRNNKLRPGAAVTLRAYGHVLLTAHPGDGDDRQIAGSHSLFSILDDVTGQGLVELVVLQAAGDAPASLPGIGWS